jgi:amino acid transporter
MKKLVLTYGLIMGVIFSAGTIYMSELLFYKNPEIKSNDLLGYVVMVIIYSLIFIGIRNYRNNQNNGVISFKKAFKIGAMITLIASTLYVVICLIYLYQFAPDYIEKYTEYVLRHTSPSELEAKTQTMEDFKTMYRNPLIVTLLTYAEILPLGLVVSLISSFILKKKEQ